jgi:hypothetical protein
MADVAKYCLGVSLLPLGMEQIAAAAADASPQGQGPSGKKATHLIYLFMNGAMSQLDTFDPKPKSESQGQTSAIQTSLASVQFGEHLPQLAKQTGRLAVIRSMNTTTGAHEPARYLMSTSYKPIATTRHPGLGSWVHLMLGRAHKTLPVAIQIGGGIGPGYLGAKFAPVPIGDPALGLQNTKSPGYLTDDAFDKRMELSHTFDTVFRRLTKGNRQVTGYDDLYRDAIALLRSQDLKAFDIAQEPEDQRKAYGNSRFGKGCLLARRLVESGVRYVEVSLGSWDHHYELWEKLPGLAADLDRCAATLLNDLNARGLLQDTLVVIGTEFGRKPEINQNSGRDHHPAAYSCVLAGGGIRGGQVYGSTDANAFHVEEDGVTPGDLNATIAQAMGIQHDKVIHSPDGRPFTLGNQGTPIQKLFG